MSYTSQCVTAWKLCSRNPFILCKIYFLLCHRCNISAFFDLFLTQIAHMLQQFYIFIPLVVITLSVQIHSRTNTLYSVNNKFSQHINSVKQGKDTILCGKSENVIYSNDTKSYSSLLLLRINNTKYSKNTSLGSIFGVHYIKYHCAILFWQMKAKTNKFKSNIEKSVNLISGYFLVFPLEYLYSGPLLNK